MVPAGTESQASRFQNGTCTPAAGRRSHGVMPLYTPLSGSWLNLAESVQRITVRRALDGQHPQSQDERIAWLVDTVAGWNADPTPFTWHGKRHERRQRARQRHLGGSVATLAHPQAYGA